MGPSRLEREADDVIPLTRVRSRNEPGEDEEEDLDVHGLVSGEQAGDSSRTYRAAGHTDDDVWQQLNHHFARLWHRVPASWSVERDPAIAMRHVLTLLGFLSLCIFVFSVPSLLYVISPRAPTPPGTSPPLDEAASTVSGQNGAVAADVPQCSELGVRVLRDLGGNAIDAMVSTVLCQGVLAPFASGLGGGALILIHAKNHPDDIGITRFYDARETAPAAANMAAFSQNATTSRFGGLAVAVPGELRGLYRAHLDFGRLPWRDVVHPVVEIAKDAKIGKFLAVKLQQMNDTILSSPTLSRVFTKKVLTDKGKSQQDAAASAELPGVRRFSVNASASVSALEQSYPYYVRGVADALSDGSVVADANDKDEHGVTPRNHTANETHVTVLLKEGDEIKNEALVQTLRAIGNHGPDAFYHNMSETLSKEIRDAGGIITAKDIQGYAVKTREVLQSTYQGFTIFGASVPSVGGVSIAMALNMITELEFRRKGRNSVSFQLLAECMKWVFGAAMGLADPDFVQGARWRMRRMLSRREALRRAYSIDWKRTYGPQRYAPRVSTSALDGGTSHISIVDRNGSAVSVTSSINLPFGAGLMSSSSGVVLNDQMDAFTTKPTRLNAYGMYPTTENEVAGGKRPVTSMCPTIVIRGKLVYLVLGGSGGPKAITGVLQTLLNTLDFGDSLGNAISAPRIHHQLVPNVLSLEAANVSTCGMTDALRRPSHTTGSSAPGRAYWESVCNALKKVGHHLEGPAVHGAVQAVLVPGALKVEENRKIFAASDHRRIGKAAAY